jgi:AmmeMemoRadiSam system protein B
VRLNISSVPMTLALVLVLLSQPPCALSAPDCEGEPFARQFTDRALFDSAIDTASTTPEPRLRVGGLTVPHHLAAADLIARAFALVEPEAFDKIVVLSPDHFRRARLAFATTARPFDTVFGLVCTDKLAVASLLSHRDIVQDSDLFGGEHGIGAILPFLRRYFPAVPIVPIAVSIASRRPDWDALLAALEPIAGSRTLVVQSTDFSHYLGAGEAALRDQFTLNVLSASAVDEAARLFQPSNLDSRGAQYLQMQLQARRGSAPIVAFNRNSQAYSKEHEPVTTSYIVQLYPREPVDRVLPALPGSHVVCFAGDMFVGRFMVPVLSSKQIVRQLEGKLHSILQGCPTIANLEGAFGAQGAMKRANLKLAMDGRLAVAWLKKLNITAVSLANNHSHDLGPRAYRQTAATLRRASIRILEHGRMADFGLFRLIAFSDIDNMADPTVDRITDSEIAAIASSPALPPLAAFMHWGKEYTAAPQDREMDLTNRLASGAVGLIVGAHPHVRSDKITLVHGGRVLLVYSLGNFLFDQSDARTSGAILEMRVFDQGTFFCRLIPMPNLYREAVGYLR